jgi:hypothetical protein
MGNGREGGGFRFHREGGDLDVHRELHVGDGHEQHAPVAPRRDLRGEEPPDAALALALRAHWRRDLRLVGVLRHHDLCPGRAGDER